MTPQQKQLIGELKALEKWGFNDGEICNVLGLRGQQELLWLRNLVRMQDQDRL